MQINQEINQISKISVLIKLIWCDIIIILILLLLEKV